MTIIAANSISPEVLQNHFAHYRPKTQEHKQSTKYMHQLGSMSTL